MPRLLSVTTLGTSGKARLTTTTGRCFDAIRIAESDMRDELRTSPSASGTTRSTACRSTREDSWMSPSSKV